MAKLFASETGKEVGSVVGDPQRLPAPGKRGGAPDRGGAEQASGIRCNARGGEQLVGAGADALRRSASLQRDTAVQLAATGAARAQRARQVRQRVQAPVVLRGGPEAECAPEMAHAFEPG